MFPSSNSNSLSHKQRATIAAAWLLGIAALLLPSAYGGAATELLGTDKKSVSRILGDGQELASGLFNEESSASHSGGIGSTHAYRTRVGYLGGDSCYAFFMKKTGESFNPIEVFGLLYLCANRAQWRELEVDGSTVGFIYRADNPKGKGKSAGRTYLATIDDSASKLFVYSPEWRPDFNRELWITPDEAPVHRELGRAPLPRRSSSKQSTVPDATLFGKSTRPRPQQSNAKQVIPDPKGVTRGKNPPPIRSDAKQGIYLPKLDQVVPSDPKKMTKRGKRKRNKQQGKVKPKPTESSK